ncbi:MAG: insulinase family protein [Oscillospiraceae bacterium]|nr:insulinase family protein [Oscillospiraceae bacterium]
MIEKKEQYIGAPENGIRLITVTDPKFKKTSVTIHFIFPMDKDTASADSYPAYIIEDTNSDYPRMDKFFGRLSELYGASVSTSNSQMGDYRTMVVSGSVISDKYALEGEHLAEELAKVMTSCIFRPVLEDGLFPQKQFDLKKNEFADDIITEINEKRSYAIKKAKAAAFCGEPCAAPMKGELESAKALSREDALAAYKKILRTASVDIFYCGSEISEDALRVLRDSFTGLEREDVCRFERTPSPLKPEPGYTEETMDIVQSKMVMAFKHDSHTPEEVRRLFVAIYGNSPFSLLFKNVREKLSLCYYCSLVPFSSKSAMFVDSGLEAANAETAQKEILNQLEVMKAGTFPDEMLEQAKLATLTSLKAVTDFPGSITSWYFDRLYSDSKVSPEEFAELVKAVTKEQIVEFANSLHLDTVYLLKGAQS